MNKTPVAVTSRTFSRHPVLRAELEARFSDIRFNDAGATLRGAELTEFLKDRTGAIIALESVTREVLSQLPSLKVISKYGVGLNNLDLQALKDLGVHLAWRAGVNRRSVAELALSLILGSVRQVFTYTQEMREGTWLQHGGSEVSGKTIGLIGFGNIGTELARLLGPFQCRLLVHDVRDVSADCRSLSATQVSLEELLRESAVVSLHVPYDESTHHLIGARELEAMKTGSVLINTSRGNVVEEQALLDALVSGKLGASATDVFAQEPPTGSPLLKHPRFFATPHVGGASEEGVLAMGRSAITGLVAALTAPLK